MSIQVAVSRMGSQTALARAVNVTPQAVQMWVKLGRVSINKLVEVERVSGVSRQQLRPDLFTQD